MLATLREVLKIAEEKKCAIGSFNTPNMESLYAVITAAEKLNMPVIIMHAQIHEEMGVAYIDVIGRMMIEMAKTAKVPVCVHLDHGTSLSYVKKALDVGFTSVMYDGSEEEYHMNCIGTRVIVELAKQTGASVEAEIGSMGKREGGGEGGAQIYTDPNMAKEFVDITGVDALACSFGTAHGIYLTKPKLDFDRLKEINSMVDVPLVMHGGSGVSEEDYKKVISLGVRKINYYSYMAKAGGSAVIEMKDKTFFHDIAAEATRAMEENASGAMKIFGMGKF